jgi:hypothetical protein
MACIVDTRDKLFTVSTTPPINFSLAINCIDDKGLVFLQNCELRGKIKDAAVRRQRCV